MIIVTGTNGELGRRIVRQLVERTSAGRVGATCRDPAKAHGLAALGVRVRQGDFAEPDGLAHAFEGVEQLLLVSSNARAQGGDPLAQHRNAIEAARAAGAKRIVYTSQMAASTSSAFPPMHDHAATEAMLDECGLAWTALRHGFYGASGVAMLGAAMDGGTLETAADGKLAWAAHDDLAEAAAVILMDEGRHEGPTPPLTGAEALDFGDLADIASEVLDKPVRREVLTDEAMRAKVLARGAPERAADMVLGLYIGARNGEWATIDPTLEQLLGRRPITMRALIAQSLDGKG